MMNIKRVISTIEKNYILSNLKKDQRLDGRDLWQQREWSIKSNVIASAEGSAEVTLGKTQVITGVKYDVGTPFPDLPNEGVCTFMAELLPLASPLFERGPPNEQSIELARVVDRGIRHADCVQTKKLCIKEKKAVYIIFVDIYVINYSGNLIDAGGISSLTALISSKIPEGKWENDEVVWTGKYLTGDTLVNELPIVGRISISVTEDKITSIQKSGVATFSIEEVEMLAKKSMDSGKKLRKDLNLWQYKR